MKRKSKFLKTYFTFIAILVLTFSSISFAYADATGTSDSGIAPTPLSNNPVRQGEIKVDSPIDKDWEGTINGIPYIVHFDVSEDGKYLTFYTGDHPGEGPDIVAEVLVKGGNAAYLYTYTNLENADSGLRSPLNNGGQIPEISHYTFVLREPKATAEPTTTTTASAPTTTASAPTTTAEPTTTAPAPTTTAESTTTTTAPAPTTTAPAPTTTTTAEPTTTTTESTTATQTSAATVAVFGATFTSDDPPAAKSSLIVAAGEMPNTGETGYNVRVIVFMTLLLIGTLLIFWKYKLQEVPSEQD